MKFFLLLLSIGAAICSDVLELTDSNFKDQVKGKEILLVEFYAPWCGHCKRLAPEYEKAATTLLRNDPPIPIAKVDCVGEGKESCTKYGVSGYPTLKIFRNGDFSQEYDGPRDAPGIVSYMKKNSGPSSVDLKDYGHLDKKLGNSEEIVVVDSQVATQDVPLDNSTHANKVAELMLNNSKAADLERERERARLMHAIEEQELRKESANLRIAIKQSNRKVKKEKEMKKEEEEEMKKMEKEEKEWKEKEWKEKDKYDDHHNGYDDHYKPNSDHQDDKDYKDHSKDYYKDHPNDHYEDHPDDHYNYNDHPDNHGDYAEHDSHPDSHYNHPDDHGDGHNDYGHHDDHPDDHYNYHNPDHYNDHGDAHYKDHSDNHYNGHGDEHYDYPDSHHDGDSRNHNGPYYDEEHGNHYADHPDAHYDDHGGDHYGNYGSDHHNDHGHYDEDEGCNPDEHECGDNKSSVSQQNGTISENNSTEYKLQPSKLEGWKAHVNESDPNSIAVMVPTNETNSEISKEMKETEENNLKSEENKEKGTSEEKEKLKMSEDIKSSSNKDSSSPKEESEGGNEHPPLTAKIGVGSLQVNNLSVAILIPQNIQDLLGLKSFNLKDGTAKVVEGLNSETIKECIDQLKIKPNSEENSVCKQVISNLGKEVVDNFASVTQVNNMKVLYNGKEDHARIPLVSQTNSLKVNYANESKSNLRQDHSNNISATHLGGYLENPTSSAVSMLDKAKNISQEKDESSERLIKNKQMTLSQLVNKTKSTEGHLDAAGPGTNDKTLSRKEQQDAKSNEKPNVSLLKIPPAQKMKDSSPVGPITSNEKETSSKLASPEKVSAQSEPVVTESINYNGKPATNTNKLKKELDETLIHEQLNSLSDTLTNTMKDAFNGIYDAGLTSPDLSKQNQV